MIEKTDLPVAKPVAMAPPVRMDEPADKVEGDRFICWDVNHHLRWAVECIRYDKEKRPIRVYGKHGPDWDFITDPYATINMKIIDKQARIKRVYTVVDVFTWGVEVVLDKKPSVFEPPRSGFELGCTYFKHSEYTKLMGTYPLYDRDAVEYMQTEQKWQYMNGSERRKWLEDNPEIQDQTFDEDKVKEAIRRRNDNVIRRRRSVLRAEQEHLKKYQETGIIPVGFMYLVWRNGVSPRKGEPKTLEVKLKPRIIKHKTKYRPVRR